MIGRLYAVLRAYIHVTASVKVLEGLYDVSSVHSLVIMEKSFYLTPEKITQVYTQDFCIQSMVTLSSAFLHCDKLRKTRGRMFSSRLISVCKMVVSSLDLSKRKNRHYQKS